MAYQPIPGSIVSYQAPGSIISASVFGQVGASVVGHSPVVIVGGSVATSTTNSSVQLLNSANVVGSVAVLQGTNPFIITGSVQTTVNTGNSSVQVLNFPTTQNVSGSVVSFIQNIPQASVHGVVQIGGTSPNSIAGVKRLDEEIIGSTLGIVSQAVIHGKTSAGGGNYVDVKVTPSGALVVEDVVSSVISFQGGTRITSIVSSIPSSVLVGASIFGQLPGGTATLGSVVTIQGTNPHVFTGSVQGTVSVLGTVPVTQSGTWITSLVSIVPSSVIVGASVFGNVGISGTPNVNTAGSIVAFQGTTPWAVTNVGSIISTNIGSIITVSKDSSIISRSAPLASVVQGVADLRVVQGASVAILAGPGTGIRNYVEHVQVANFGSASVLVVIRDNTTSTLGWTIAPAGGGSNYDCFYQGAAGSPITASINGTASVLVSAQGFTA